MGQGGLQPFREGDALRDWTSHPHFPRPEPEQYYNDCIQRIGDLADWFFHGVHSYAEPHHWSDL